MKKLSLAYFGSPDFAAEFLEKLITDPLMYRYIEVKLVVTQPDSPVGRKQILTPTPVKKIANNFQFSIFNFQSNLNFQNSKNEKSMRNEKFKMKIKELDLALVYAYGDLIPKELLTLPKYGFWNIHPSLLPKYRGPSPIAAPIINGDKTTGVTIIKMDEEIDHGPIIAQESLTIEKDDKRPDLEKKLTDLGFEMFKKIVENEGEKFFSLSRGAPKGRDSRVIKNYDPEFYIPQNHQQATYTKKFSKQDGFIFIENLKFLLAQARKISNFSEILYNRFRGLYPWPGIWTIIPDKPHFAKASRGKRLKITDLEFVNGKLIIQKVQLEGKNEVDFETFNKAYKVF